ncbi:MAG: YihY/virulence factor BrkB family protein [Cyanobacteria bacterium Co-bin8]|nr:YihY/virulence factor BrkB family protein [Cyanobacteria bacterium Co-bin8]
MISRAKTRQCWWRGLGFALGLGLVLIVQLPWSQALGTSPEAVPVPVVEEVARADHALLFLVGQFFFGIFLNMANVGSAYGVAGSFLIVITWIFYAANILFVGAAFTKVYAWQRGAPIVPSDFAVACSDNSTR